MTYPLSLPTENPLVTVTHPKDSIWVIELHNGQDNRLIPALVDHALKPALDAVELHWRNQWREAQNSKDKSGGKGAVIIVGRKDQEKFFSNGQSFVTCTPAFFLTADSVPTICAINGHCFAGGFMLSLACDYRVMTDGSKRRAWLCMNEIDFGAVWPHSDGRTRREIALGHRYEPNEALSVGIVDHIVTGNTNAVLAKAEELALAVGVKAQGGVWGLIKNDLYYEPLKTLKRDPRMSNPQVEDAAAKARL
ncbi:Enoyl-CoA delta isomerase 3 [Mycena sanguinolenta]|uniref:Enoyl-CoA delta isomerase 3 n=1 Tax=Mycena sanguinolenta TaxID=230812 RepID=A0A8H6ZD76_9AGAR|nr:Enoyl-CoA delta isomerase 3 [Mycena sanguinolenta]